METGSLLRLIIHASADLLDPLRRAVLRVFVKIIPDMLRKPASTLLHFTLFTFDEPWP